MICPSCKSLDSGVIETRLARGRNQPEAESYGVRRRRQCNVCKHRWTTVEISAELLVSVVNVLEGVRNLIASVAKIPDKPLLDMSTLFDDTRALRSQQGRCNACGGPCRFPAVGIDPVTGEHYFGG